MRKNTEPRLQRLPLYQQAANLLRDELGKITPGSYLPSERILSEQYGISITTLREAVRILSAEGLVTRLQGKGTVINERTVLTKGWVAILIHHDISQPGASSVYVNMAQALHAVLDEASVPARLYISRRVPGLEQTDFHCPEFFADLAAGQIAAVAGVLLAAHSPWLRELEKQGLPVVGFGLGKQYSVAMDAKRFLKDAVAELKGRGRKRLALMTWGGYRADRSATVAYFREVMAKAGLTVVEPWIKDDLYPAMEGAGWTALREIWSAEREKPDGVIVTDDFFASGVVAAVEELGLVVPAQMEIAIWASHRRSAHYTLPMIVWETVPELPGRALAEMLLTLLRGERPARLRLLLPPRRAPELDVFSPPPLRSGAACLER